MPFEALESRLPRLSALPEGQGLWADVPSGRLGAFSDDLVVATNRSLRVRVTTQSRGGRIYVDFRDSDGAHDADGFGVDHDDATLATVLAVCRALNARPEARWTTRIDVITSKHSWVGGHLARDPGRRAMGLARAYDAVLGALASSWPGRVAAGSCTVGAVVELRCGPDVVTEAIAGGEGANPERAGQLGWVSPVLGPVTTAGFFPWLSVAQRPRPGSGGGGARRGAAGVERSYTVTEDVDAVVGIDRIDNPPHGLERAGPPVPGALTLTVPGGERVDLQPWIPFTIPRGATLCVETSGGAGHGFGGYGDIEFDPTDWFGSKRSK